MMVAEGPFGYRSAGVLQDFFAFDSEIVDSITYLAPSSAPVLVCPAFLFDGLCPIYFLITVGMAATRNVRGHVLQIVLRSCSAEPERPPHGMYVATYYRLYYGAAVLSRNGRHAECTWPRTTDCTTGPIHW